MPMPMPRPEPVKPLHGGTAASQPRFRCIHRPTGEWFTFAPNEPGSDLPDATELYTEREVRGRLAELGFKPAVLEQMLAYARAHAEVSSGEGAPVLIAI
jgi:hypothetical protein